MRFQSSKEAKSVTKLQAHWSKELLKPFISIEKKKKNSIYSSAGHLKSHWNQPNKTIIVLRALLGQSDAPPVTVYSI